MKTPDAKGCIVRLDLEYLQGLQEYMSSGRLAEDFEHSAEERRYEILEFLEQLMDLGELADEVATGVIFKNSQLQALFGENSQK
ncbi:MAG: hypothetical protein ACLFOA_05335 [Desulfohalobiaceae bacterium]